MTLKTTELLCSESGASYLGEAEIQLRRADHGVLNDLAKMSAPLQCQQAVYIEMPIGFHSSRRMPDRDQTAVVLQGELLISSEDHQTAHLKAGAVFSLPKAQTSSHTLEVLGDSPVILLVLLGSTT